MNYASVKKHDISNGPGVRVSLYVSGCSHHCKGCFNPETWDFDYGEIFDENTENEILAALEPSYIKGFSLLGGEPFEPENRRNLTVFLGKMKQILPNKTIWCYTGYDYEKDLLVWAESDEDVQGMLSCIDVLVDGEFQEENKVIDLRFRGSLNQRIIDVNKSRSSGCTELWSD